MRNVSRRSVLAGLGLAGLSTFSSLTDAGGASLRKAPVSSFCDPALKMTASARGAATSSLLEYFRQVAPKLLRPAAGILKHPSISPALPGATYSTQLWDWDTYWTTRGLFRIARLLKNREMHEEIVRHAQGSLFNFLDYQSASGRVPIMMESDNPDPFGSLEGGSKTRNNQAKPIFGQLALLIADEFGSVEWLAPRFDQLVRFYNSWVVGNLSQVGLLVWGDDVAIGDDNDPTTFGRPFFSSANLLLNCLYYQDLRAAAQLADRLGRREDEEHLSQRAGEQGRAIQKCCWDPRDRFYYTVDVQCVDRRGELIPGMHKGMSMSWNCLFLRIQTFTGFLPLWCGLATREQAGDLLKLHLLNYQTFNSQAGIRSLSAQETMYSLISSGNPSNWLGPVWIIVNYFVWKGLKTYGFAHEADALADKTLRVLASDLAQSGALNEYYDPDTGAPLSHTGFLDWNLLVTEMFDA